MIKDAKLRFELLSLNKLEKFLINDYNAQKA